jgi:cytochrome P450
MTFDVTPDNVLELDLFGMVEEGTRREATSVPLHQVLRDFRADGPVHQGGIQQTISGVPSIADIAAAQDGSDVVAVVGYDEVLSVLRDPSSSSEVYMPSIGSFQGRSILAMDPPDHGKYRGAVQGAFSKRLAEEMRHEVINPIVTGLLGDIARSGTRRADLFSDFAMVYPTAVLHAFLGLNKELEDAYFKLGVSTLLFTTAPEVAFAGMIRLGELLRQDIASRRDGSYHRAGLLEDLLKIEVDGHLLSEEEIFPYISVLLAAGAETSMRATSNLLLALLTLPEQRALLEGDPSLIGRAVEETLRWEGPTTAVFRKATADTEIAGVPIAAGTALELWIASANHDDAVFTDADAFDIGRPVRPHVGFGFGAHLCLGLHIARAESSTAVLRVLDRFPDIRLDPDQPVPEVVGYAFRSPTRLPVVF